MTSTVVDFTNKEGQRKGRKAPPRSPLDEAVLRIQTSHLKARGFFMFVNHSGRLYFAAQGGWGLRHRLTKDEIEYLDYRYSVTVSRDGDSFGQTVRLWNKHGEQILEAIGEPRRNGPTAHHGGIGWGWVCPDCQAYTNELMWRSTRRSFVCSECVEGFSCILLDCSFEALPPEENGGVQ